MRRAGRIFDTARVTAEAQSISSLRSLFSASCGLHLFSALKITWYSKLELFKDVQNRKYVGSSTIHSSLQCPRTRCLFPLYFLGHDTLFISTWADFSKRKTEEINIKKGTRKEDVIHFSYESFPCFLTTANHLLLQHTYLFEEICIFF